MKIKMLKTVRPDCPFILKPSERKMVLIAGEIYDAGSNTLGAVYGICRCGNKLGVKPDEFEFVE